MLADARRPAAEVARRNQGITPIAPKPRKARLPGSGTADNESRKSALSEIWKLCSEAPESPTNAKPMSPGGSGCGLKLVQPPMNPLIARST